MIGRVAPKTPAQSASQTHASWLASRAVKSIRPLGVRLATAVRQLVLLGATAEAALHWGLGGRGTERDGAPVACLLGMLLHAPAAAGVWCTNTVRRRWLTTTRGVDSYGARRSQRRNRNELACARRR